MTQTDLFLTPEAQKAAFFFDLKNGAQLPCPCCERYSQIYHRSIHSGIAFALVKLHRLTNDGEFLHISKFASIGAGADTPIARFWGLIEAKTNDDTQKKTSGEWRLTDKGRRFVKNEATIAKYVMLFDNKFFGRSEERITIKDALKDKFDYAQLMGEA